MQRLSASNELPKFRNLLKVRKHVAAEVFESSQKLRIQRCCAVAFHRRLLIAGEVCNLQREGATVKYRGRKTHSFEFCRALAVQIRVQKTSPGIQAVAEAMSPNSEVCQVFQRKRAVLETAEQTRHGSIEFRRTLGQQFSGNLIVA